MTIDSLTFAQEVLDAQPFNQLVGARLTDFGGGRATLQLPVEDRHRQQFDLVHGGVLSYLADNVLTFACGSVLGPSVVTGGFTISYLQGAREGTLRASAIVQHSNSRLATATAQVVLRTPDGSERLCAIAQGTVLSTSRGEEALPA